MLNVMIKVIFETNIDCGEFTCNDCTWIHGEKVSDPYCGWFNWYSSPKPKNTTLGKYGTVHWLLKRLPECIASKKEGDQLNDRHNNNRA